MLADRHLAFLRARAVSDGVIARRGYATITDPAELGRHGFSPKQAQRYVPGLLIPRRGLNGKLAAPKFRPDQEGRNGPVQNRDGKVTKYASPTGAWNFVDMLPDTRLHPGSEIWLSAEGFIKADAIVSSAGLPAVAIDGIYGWRSQGETVLGIEVLATPGRWWHVVCDSDYVSNPDVGWAMLRLRGWLRARGCRVRVLFPPSLGPKVGVDDFLAGGNDIGGLIEAGPQAPLGVRRSAALRRFLEGWPA